MKIAVTSASGHLGSAIVNQLKKDIGKQNIIAIARTPKNAEHLGVEVRQGDYNFPEHFNNALQGVDRLLLISGMDKPEARIDQHRNVYNLVGTAITQTELCNYINQENKTTLVYQSMKVAEYEQERKAALGDFIGTIIAGIYDGIRTGAFDVKSDFEKASGRKHRSPTEIIQEIKSIQFSS